MLQRYIKLDFALKLSFSSHRLGKATAVGNMPGVTRSVLTRIRMSNDPLIYLIDTPGIMMPNISNMHAGLKLALCGKALNSSSILTEY